MPTDEDDGTGCILVSSHSRKYIRGSSATRSSLAAVEDELDGDGRKEDAEDMGEDVRYGERGRPWPPPSSKRLISVELAQRFAVAPGTPDPFPFLIEHNLDAL